MIPCSSCNTPTERIDLFPKNLCLKCYETTPEGTRIVTAEELARMWGAKI